MEAAGVASLRHRSQRTVRGRSDWLGLLHRTLSFHVPSPFIPALWLSPSPALKSTPQTLSAPTRFEAILGAQEIRDNRTRSSAGLERVDRGRAGRPRPPPPLDRLAITPLRFLCVFGLSGKMPSLTQEKPFLQTDQPRDESRWGLLRFLFEMRHCGRM